MALSDIFKYISKFRSDGHSIGRKVGDLLEVLVYGSLIHNNILKNKLHIEPKLYGFCDSGHKVEFAITKKNNQKTLKGGKIEDPSILCGFIECKKVGVEQTINSSYKKKYHKFNFNFELNSLISFTFDKSQFELTIVEENNNVFIKINYDDKNIKEILEEKHRIIIAASSNKKEIILNNKSLRDFKSTLEKCKIIEISKIKDKFNIIINDCLPGPQTPEKAKQSSFVALDVRKLRYGKFDKDLNEKDFISVLVITEANHWENKSRNMVRSCLDKTLIVEDSILIETMIDLEKKFGPKFVDLISKNEFENNKILQELILNIIQKYKGKIYTDLDDNNKVAIDMNDNFLIFR